MSTLSDRFITAFEDFQAEAATINQKNGFTNQDSRLRQLQAYLIGLDRCEFLPLLEQYENARIGLKLALVTSELSEALEAVRTNAEADDHIPDFTAEEAEIADAVIRLMNYATDRKLRLADAIVAKNEYNRNRPDHRPENRAFPHGKKF